MSFFSYLCSMKWIAIFLAIACQYLIVSGQRVMTDSAWRPEVKTVTLTRAGVELERPVLTLGKSERMSLQFDMLADEAQNLRYSIAHCDADWRRDDLEPYEFMNGFEQGEIENYEFSFTTRRPYIHYFQAVPAKFAEFTHSGNYLLAVTDEEGDTLLTRRFWLTEESVKVMAEVTRPYDGMGLLKRQEVDVEIDNSKLKIENFSAPQLRPEWERVRVVQNGRDDDARWLEFSGYDGAALCYRYRPCNVFWGGNTFRYFDCSNLFTPMYNVQRVEEYGGELFAILQPEEDRSKKHYLSETTLNGGMKVNIQGRQRPAVEADYVWVNISLPMAQPWLDRSVYVVGQLTDWKLDSTSRMDYNPKYKAYVKRLLLKQGYYAYQLIVKGYGLSVDGLSGTEMLEGDHMETSNTYTIFIYHREPGDRADRLLGVRQIRPHQQ